MPVYVIIILSLLVYVFLIVMLTIILTDIWPEIFLKSGFTCFSPAYLHQKTRFNWFGAILIGVILNIIYLPFVLIWYSRKIFLKKEK
ncbi:MAG: hypothetical protein J6A25_01010 [Lachnospiraceae bacterium]|nr:hypothetical protein [Lachnospiraceae bacterium]